MSRRRPKPLLPHHLCADDMLAEFDLMRSEIFEQEFAQDEERPWPKFSSYHDVMERAAIRFYEIREHPMVNAGLFEVEKPIRDGNYIRVLVMPTELGDNAYHLAQIGIAWHLGNRIAMFVVSCSDMVTRLIADEIYNRKPISEIDLAEWFSIFPKQGKKIEALLERRAWVEKSIIARRRGIYWDAKAHCADKESTLEKFQDYLDNHFSEVELRWMRKVIPVCHEYWPDDVDFQDIDERITIEVLSRYLVDGNYVRENV